MASQQIVPETPSMSSPLSLAELEQLHPIAEREASRVCRIARLPAHEREDIRQDMLLDLLVRLPAFDPTRGTLAGFATVCFRHRGIRLAERLKRERAVRVETSLDSPVAGDDEDELTLADLIPDSEGLGAWWGQPTDAIAAIERRLSLGRAEAAIDPADHSLCAALVTSTPHQLARRGLMPRSVLYRRIREMRLRLLAAGISTAA
jgi:RNA polymerase sigma-70 factor (ECF subfamily)